MALQLTHETESGTSGNYWKIAEVRITRSVDKAEIRVCLYKDAAARAGGKTEMLSRRYIASGFDLTAMQGADDPIALAYAKLKDIDDFTGATDV